MPPEGELLLLQISASHRLDFDFWTNLFICISREAFQKRRFDKAHCYVDEC